MSSRPLPLVSVILVLLLAGAGGPGAGADGALAAPTDPPDPATPAACPVPVCRYEGTSWVEELVGDELVDRGEARVDWRFSHMSGREAVYVPAGSVSAAWRTERCAITLDPATTTFTSASPSVRHARLNVDFTTRPVRYSGTGTAEWAGRQVWSCRGDVPFTQDGVATKWFSVNEATSDDPGLLRGTAESEGTRSGWSFVNAP